MQPSLAASPDLPPLTETGRKLLAIIEDQARAHDRALTNEDYAEILGVDTVSTVSRILRILTRAGLIAIERNGATQQRRFRALRLEAMSNGSHAGSSSAKRDSGHGQICTMVSAPRERSAIAVTVRPCMCCREPFPSEGIGHRLCDPCKGRDGPPLSLDGVYASLRSPASMASRTPHARRAAHPWIMRSSSEALAHQARRSSSEALAHQASRSSSEAKRDSAINDEARP